MNLYLADLKELAQNQPIDSEQLQLLIKFRSITFDDLLCRENWQSNRYGLPYYQYILPNAIPDKKPQINSICMFLYPNQ